MSDISKRLNELERVAKANEPNDDYKNIYPLMPLEFTELIYKQGEPEQALVEIWHEVIDDYEQEHLDELHEHLKANILPPWRRLVDLSERKRNSASFDKCMRYDKELGLEPSESDKEFSRLAKLEVEVLENQEQILTKRALELYERRKSEGKI